MPTMNIYTDRGRVEALASILPGLGEYAAKELSCGDITLASNEVSLRVIVPDASLRIADTEIDMSAYSFPDRVARQDEICLSIKEYVERECPDAGSVYVWLQLDELGHSAKE